jgi:hypothetical protein
MPPQAGCNGACSGCAFKQGAAANQEANNRLRGILTALGGIPFVCHSSIGWTPDKNGYPLGAMNAIDVIMSPKLQKALKNVTGDDPLADPAMIEFRSQIRMCAGWRSAVARLKKAGWFASKDVSLVRRHAASSAARDLAGLSDKKQSKADKAMRMKNLRDTFDWFMREARDSKVKIGWLLK